MHKCLIVRHLQKLQEMGAQNVLVSMAEDGALLLDENGKVDVAKLQPITYDPMNHHYLLLGEKAGQAFQAGLSLK